MHRLISAIWLGAGVFLMLAAPAVFKVAPNPTVAADVVGAMLARWHYIALLAPILLFALLLKRAKPVILGVLVAALLFALVQIVIDLKIRAIRQSTPVPIGALDRRDPIRRRFGALHGASMLLAVLETIAAAAVVTTPSRD